MECTQAEAFEQYIRDLRVVRSISRPSFPDGKAPAAVLEEIQTNALRCNALMRQNEALLAQFVYDRDPASLTETDIQGLSAFAGRLFNYANSEDMGVAFKVHQLLLAAARSREDVPMIVRELYYTGITLHYMNVRDEGTGINLLGDAIQVYFTEAAESMSRYEQLDRNTRQYLIRCVGNTRLGMSRGTHAESCRYLERFRRAMEVIQSAHYHALDPEFPWESYIYSMHMDRMTLLTHLRQEEDPEVARQVLESAEYIWGTRRSTRVRMRACRTGGCPIFTPLPATMPGWAAWKTWSRSFWNRREAWRRMIILPRPSTGSWFWRPIFRSMQNVWMMREHRGIVQPWSRYAVLRISIWNRCRPASIPVW